MKCQEGKLEYINKTFETLPENESKWIELYNQYLEKFGLGSEFEKYIDIKKELIELKLEFVKTGDVSLLNQIEIESSRLKLHDPNNANGMDINQCLIHLRKWVGSWIETKKITIVEFKYLLQEYVTSNQER